MNKKNKPSNFSLVLSLLPVVLLLIYYIFIGPWLYETNEQLARTGLLGLGIGAMCCAAIVVLLESGRYKLFCILPAAIGGLFFFAFWLTSQPLITF